MQRLCRPRAGGWLTVLAMTAVIGVGSLLGAAAPVTGDGAAMHEASPTTTYRADILDDLIDLIEEWLGDP